MADQPDLQVSIGVDTTELINAFAGLRAQTEALTTQMSGLSRSMLSTASSAGTQVKGALEGAQAAAKGLSDGVTKTGASLHGAGAGLGFFAREAHAMIDELSSGRIRQFEGTLTNVAGTFLAANTALIPYAASLAAVAAAIGYVGYQAYEAGAAVNSLRLDAAVNQFQLTNAAAADLRDSIEKLAGVSASDAAAIAKPFLTMGQVGGTVAQMLAPVMRQLAEEMGGDVAKAAQEVAKRFSDLGGAGIAFVNASRAMTDAEKQHFAQLVAGGHQTAAYAVLIDLMTRSLETLKHETDLATAASKDHVRAMSAAASGNFDLSAAEKEATQSTAATTARIQEQSSQLENLRARLLSASTAAATFEQGMTAALHTDVIASGIKSAEEEVKTLEAALAVAPDHATAATKELGRALDIAREKYKNLQNQMADPVVGSNKGELAQFQEAEQMKAATSRATSQQILVQQIADNQRELSDTRLTEEEKQRLSLDTAQKQRQLFDQTSKAGVKASHDVLGSEEQSIEGQIRALEDQTRATVDHLEAQVKLKQITAKAGEDAAIAALKHEESAVDALYKKEEQLAGLNLTKKQELINKELQLNDQVALKIQEAQEKAAQQSEKAWETYTKEINTAFDSQINGLLRGTTSWNTALKNVLATLTEDVVKFFVNWGLQAVENEAKQLALQNAVVASHVAGAATMAGADQTSAAAGSLAWVGSALKTLSADAASVFGGVFGFLAPTMGPAAAGPATAASASVLAGAGALAAADIGMWQVPGDMPALIHRNELVMPAAQAGAFRSMLDTAAGGGDGGSGGGNSYTHHGDIISNASDPREVAKQVAALWNRNPSMRPRF